MKDLVGLMTEFEMTIRAEYEAKIAALEEECDEKIARVRAALGDETRGGGTSKRRPPARPASPPPAARPKQQPANDGATVTDRVRAAAFAQASDFGPAEIRAALPDVPKEKLAPILRRLADDGEIKLVKAGNKNAWPPVYRAKGKLAVAPKRTDDQRPEAAPPSVTASARLAKVRGWIVARSASFTKADVEREFAATHEEFPLAIAGLLGELERDGHLSRTGAKDAALFTPIRREARA